MQRPGAVIGAMVALAALLATTCGANPPTVDTSELESVDCPEGTVPTELEVTCHRYPRDVGHLAVAILHAEKASADPVLVIHGGPGGRAVAERHHWLAPRSPILARHDMILVDQRGSGWSEPSLDCPEVDQPAEGLYDAYRACRTRLVKSGVDLSRYRVADIVADLSALRRSVGIDRWNLYAISFGTLVALELLRTDGDGIAATVLDSPLPPQIAAYDEHPRGAGAAIDTALARCSGVDPCPTNLVGRLDNLLDRLDKTPIAVTTRSGSTRAIDDVAFAGLLLDALAHPDGPSTLPRAVGMATEGRMAEAVALLEELGISGRTAGDTLSEGAQLSSECADMLPHNKADDPIATRPLLRAIAGREAEVRRLCSIWDVPTAQPVEGSHPPTESDILVLSGHLDPVTPTAWARRVAADLDGTILIESESWSHAPSLADPCAAGLVARFLNGFRPESGLARC